MDETHNRTETITSDSPEALIEEARQRQRRRRLWVVIVVVLLATALVVGVIMSGGSGSRSGRVGSGREGGHNPVGTTLKKNSVDLAATPKGWVPFAYEDAQISVPASWLVSFGDCGGYPTNQGFIFLGGCALSIVLGPSPPLPVNWAEMDPLPNPPGSYRGAPSEVVNGYSIYKIHYYCNPCTDAYDVPSLGVEITGAGPVFAKVLRTLSASPRAVALEHGPVATISSSWRRVSFGGLSVAVPKSWHKEFGTFYNDCWFLNDLPGSPAVILNSGTSGIDEYSASCGDQGGIQTTTLTPAPNGVLIDPGGYRREGTTGSCNNINGLSVCVVTSDPYGELTLSVQVPGRVYPTSVEIGLAGSGEVARTILYSIEKS